MSAYTLSSQSDNQIVTKFPEQNGLSGNLILQKNETMSMPRSAFSFGIYKEFLTKKSKQNYLSNGYGVSFSLKQRIYNIWSGVVEARWSDWLPQKDSKSNQIVLESISPLSVFSKIEISPFKGMQSNILSIQPFATVGIGYTFFFGSRSFLSVRPRSAFAEISGTYGGGLRADISQSMALQLSLEYWRGVQTSQYSAQLYRLELVWGDVTNI